MNTERGGRRIHAGKSWGFWLWLAGTATVVFLSTIIFTAWAVRHATLGGPRLSPTARDAVILISEFPVHVRDAVKSAESLLTHRPVMLLVPTSSVMRPHWVRRFPEPRDDGYLLFSGVYGGDPRSSIRLIRIADGRVVASWMPPWDVISQKMGTGTTGRVVSVDALRPMHPLLLPDGSVVFVVAGPGKGPLVRVDACGPSPVRWISPGDFHHSIELGEDGKSIWVPAIDERDAFGNGWIRARLRNDSLAQVDMGGRLLQEVSLSEVLVRNGMEAMAFGVAGEVFNPDPFHINQISVASRDGRVWRKGDLLVTSRHLSSVFLIRPGTWKVIWYRQGPWLNPHSARFVDDSRISLFDNNVFSGAPAAQPFLRPFGVNRVFLVDLSTGDIAQPYERLLEQARPTTITQGRAEVLADGGLFLEETEAGRHLRFTRDSLLWSRVNDYDHEWIGAVSWSRYLSAADAEPALHALREKGCSSL